MWKGYSEGYAVLFGLLVFLIGPVAWGDETRLSISGYDPVAYFTDGKLVPGSSEFEYVWHDVRWRSDITLTRAYVTDAAAFSKNADILTHYLGPLPKTSTVQLSLSAGPEFLVEIEAEANVNSLASATADSKH
jgi:hypothetical protein